jgi:hypothetical protein
MKRESLGIRMLALLIGVLAMLLGMPAAATTRAGCTPTATPPATCCLQAGKLYPVEVSACVVDLDVQFTREESKQSTLISPVWINGVPYFAIPPATRPGEYVLTFSAYSESGGSESFGTYVVE